MKTVCAVVLTYNRKELLEKCLTALIKQEYKVSKIIVIDNCSNDGTDKIIEKYKDSLQWLKLEKNYGASYGFNVGIKEGYKQGCDYIWVMDDDTIPEMNSLKMLIKWTEIDSIFNDVGFVCSDVRWSDGSACKMNIPKVSQEWNDGIAYDLVRVDSCSFVSVLFPRFVVKKVGLPISEFVIWSTDLEYTLRITKLYNYVGYCAIRSRVTHAMKVNNRTDIVLDDETRIDRYKYNFRNQMYIAKRTGVISGVKFFIFGVRTIIRIIKHSESQKIKRIRMVIWGIYRGIWFNPKIEYVQEC